MEEKPLFPAPNPAITTVFPPGAPVTARLRTVKIKNTANKGPLPYLTINVEDLTPDMELYEPAAA